MGVRMAALLRFLMRVALAFPLALLVVALPVLGMFVGGTGSYGLMVATGGISDGSREILGGPLLITVIILFCGAALLGGWLGCRLADRILRHYKSPFVPLKAKTTARVPAITPDVEAAARSHFAPGPRPQDQGAIWPADEGVQEGEG
jgi:hypothetical protein